MIAIEEERARPDIDRLFVLRGEVVIEAGEEQLFDLGVAIGLRRGVRIGAHASVAALDL
jgi:hypothetical protein